ncbi:MULTISPECIES: peptide deformylase [Sphingosinicellaceae]|uniref:peptide deformylase n=1 Tax=Sphingosinicellaceae TaxID=2820280 RepID=UPI001C1E544C|nr:MULTISPECIES: peptide deformylase [Polymorphobacter]QYE36445.1 peptide deformylase [Polymorphobacter sp. PAMC 29334]UAJ10072.1 peptide deformylase [Polymorphobacter megasporae]
MTIMPIIEAPDPRLRVISEPVAVVDDALRALMDDMLETMYDAPGIGLAAIQVGVPKRVLVIDLQRPGEVVEEGVEPADVRSPQYFVNPEIVWESDEIGLYNEGCLSVPELYGDVARPLQVRVKWLDYDGVAHEEELDGLMATCLQHEMDHLEGILFFDHLSKLKRDMIVKKLTKAKRGKIAA